MRPPPRLLVLLAESAPIAAVLRRGPSARWQVFRWQLRGDRFTPGDVFFGSVYPSASDVSPDGRYLLLNWGDYRGFGEDEDPTGDTWTTLSLLPSLAPVWRRPDPYGHYFYGGKFVDGGIHLHEHTPSDGPVGPFKRAEPNDTDSMCRRRSPNVTDSLSTANLPDDAVWAMHDTRERHIFARAGRLYRTARHGEVLLHDFNPIEPGPQVANTFVRQWRA